MMFCLILRDFIYLKDSIRLCIISFCISPTSSSHQIIEYELNHRSKKGSAKGLKFTIRARKDLYITGFDITPRKNKYCQMKVFTQPGDYRYTRNSFKKGSENTLSEENIEPGWTLVYDSNVNLKADRMVDIRVKDGQEVFIPQWEVQSFII